jgi:hypothetical protein
MPLFVTLHKAPGLSKEEFDANAPDVLAGKYASFRHAYANVFEGFIVSVYEAEDAAALQREFERVGFPFEEIHEMQLSFTREQMSEIAAEHA